MAKKDDDNGLNTKIWGPKLWFSLHCIAHGYPLKPTDEIKKKYFDFFTLVGDIMPCFYCRDSYKKFITTPNTALTLETMDARDNLCQWLYRLHNRVNEKLHKKYHVSYETVNKYYESFRAPNKDDPLRKEKLKIAFSNVYKIECPVISQEIPKALYEYALSRNLNQKYFDIYSNLSKIYPSIEKQQRNQIWDIRNKFCRHLINKMQILQLPSLETEGKWKNLPTVNELKLIFMFCSNLEEPELLEIIKSRTS